MADENGDDELAFLRSENLRLRKALHAITPDLPTMLQRKGFRVHRQGSAGDLLLPAPEFVDSYYGMLRKYSFRLFLRDVIKHPEGFTLPMVSRYPGHEVTGAYLQYLKDAGLVRVSGETCQLVRPVRSFGETLEWYTAELLRREFGAETLWGLRFKRPGVGGDYDVIAKFDSSLLYFEVKSSPPKQIFPGEVAAFVDRVDDLAPEVAFFLMDTELRMKDKIVPMFEEELARRRDPRREVRRVEKELFRAGDSLFIINAKDSIVGNIASILHLFFRR